MANNTIKTRIQLKYDTEDNWKKSVLESEGGEKVSGTSFIPLRGELIVYSADMAHPFSRLKIGDGITNVVMLPFIDAETLSGVNINNIVDTYATKASVNELFTTANVTYTVTTGTENGKIKVTPSNDSAYEVAVYGLKALAYKNNLIENDIPDLNWSKITNKPIASSNTLGIVKIGNGISINNDGVMSVSAGNLGLSGALRYQGTTTTTMQDGRTTAIVTINDSDFTPTAGDVVIYNDAEYLWTGTLWELLGAESSFKKVQTVITAPAAETNKWVSSIGQDANGNINTTYSVLNTSGTWSGTATKALQDGNGNEISSSYVKYSQGKAVDLSIEENLSILTTDEDAIRGIYFKQPTTCAYDGTAGIFYLTTPDDDIIEFTQFAFKQYSASSSTKKFTTNCDIFTLPYTSFDKATTDYYAILTTKNAVTIGQGGTGATTVSNAKANLGLGFNSVPQFQGLILHNQNDSAEYTNLTLNYKDDFTSNINLHEDGYLKIDITNLQNTSKHRGIKLDSEATINNALMFFDNSTNSIINYKIYHSGNIADLVNDLTPYFQSANGVSF